jgi:hypothetical protein
LPSLQLGVAEIGDALRAAATECIPLALESRERGRVGLAGAEVHQFAALARDVRVNEPEIAFEALVDRPRGRRAFTGKPCERKRKDGRKKTAEPRQASENR